MQTLERGSRPETRKGPPADAGRPHEKLWFGDRSDTFDKPGRLAVQVRNRPTLSVVADPQIRKLCENLPLDLTVGERSELARFADNWWRWRNQFDIAKHARRKGGLHFG